LESGSDLLSAGDGGLGAGEPTAFFVDSLVGLVEVLFGAA